MRNPGGWEILVINVVGCRRERIGAIRGVTPCSYVHILDTPQSYIWTDAEISTHGHLLKIFINSHMEKVFTQLEQSQWKLTLCQSDISKFDIWHHIWVKMIIYSVICSSVRNGAGERCSYVRNEPFAGFPWHNSWGHSRLKQCTSSASLLADIKEISPHALWRWDKGKIFVALSISGYNPSNKATTGKYAFWRTEHIMPPGGREGYRTKMCTVAAL